MESPGRGLNLKTLKRVAAAFDVALIVRFVTFGELARWVESLAVGSLDVPSFDQELLEKTSANAAMTPETTWVDARIPLLVAEGISATTRIGRPSRVNAKMRLVSSKGIHDGGTISPLTC
jgi:hypothetical protein